MPRPVHAVNTTPAYLFRKVSDEAGRPTILYDEIDTVFGPRAKDNEDIRGMLNAGHRKGAMAGRCVMRGKVVETEELPAYCAVALAGLDDLPDTIMTRAVIVRMRRRGPGEHLEPWRARINGPDAERLRQMLVSWSDLVSDRLTGDFWPSMPPQVTDRDADVWEALLAVADLAGGHWPAKAREAAVTLVTAARQRTPSIGVLLLRDVKAVFDTLGGNILRSEQILSGLNQMDESPWRSIRKGSPLDARGLSVRLNKYGIGSKPQRIGPDVVKGYSRSQFEDAWGRYLGDLPAPTGPSQPVTSVTAARPQLNGRPSATVQQTLSVTELQDSGREHPPNSANSPVTDVTEKSLPAHSPSVHCQSCSEPIPASLRSARARGICSRCIANNTATV